VGDQAVREYRKVGLGKIANNTETGSVKTVSVS
jgi:hypothetical protein